MKGTGRGGDAGPRHCGSCGSRACSPSRSPSSLWLSGRKRARSDPPALALSQSPPYSSGSYDSIKTEVSGCPEDLTVGRAPTADDDDDDHDDHEDNDKMNDSEGMDPERLKAFNVRRGTGGAGAGATATASPSHSLCLPQMFVRLFVDENLDRMVPISKQPKEKIQAIIESCSRQFPEFQERARKRIRTYLKSCRRMKKNGMEMVSPSSPSAPLLPHCHGPAATPAGPLGGPLARHLPSTQRSRTHRGGS